MAEESTPENSKSQDGSHTKATPSAPEPAESAAARARRLKRVAPVAGESRLARLSKARRAVRGPVKHPRDLLGVSLADGRYVVKAPLGKGSMAYVFRASDARLQTDVVLKVPKPEKINTADFRERFQRESQLLIRFSHPHVVKVLDVGEYEELPYVVMQLLEGGSLSDRIARESDEHGRMTPESLKTWVREVSRALDFCYRKGMVHRDVKPANILFDEDNNAYVGDFGLSKIMCGEHTELSSDETAAGVVLGTPNYISPEVVQGQDYDGRSDQYSLGITIYHVLTGGPPMQGNTATMTMLNQTQKVLPLLSDVRDDVPRPLAVAIRKAIEKDPAKRFNTCVEFAEAVVEGLRFAPVISSSSSSSLSSRSSSASSRVLKLQGGKSSKSSVLPRASVSPGVAASATGTQSEKPARKKPVAGVVRKPNTGKSESAKTATTKPTAASASGRRTSRQKARSSASSAQRRRPSSASSSLSIDADLDWFDMDSSGEYSSNRSSARSSSRSTGRRRVRKGRSGDGRLVNVFGQQLHPAVLAGLGVFAVVCLVMFVWSPFSPDEATPQLAAGQSFTSPNSAGQDSTAQGRNHSNSKKKGESGKGQSKPSTLASAGDSTSQGKETEAAATAEDSVGKGKQEGQGRSAEQHIARNQKTDLQNNDPLIDGRSEASDSDQGDQLMVERPTDLESDSEPLFQRAMGASSYFGDHSSEVFVNGLSVRLKSDGSQQALLSGGYSNDGLATISADGRWFAATTTDRADRDFVVRVWNTKTGAIQDEVHGNGRRRLRNLFLAGDLLCLETDRSQVLQIWDLKKKQAQGVLTLPENRLRSQRMGMTDDGARWAAVVDDGLSYLDGRTGTVAARLSNPLAPSVKVAMAGSATLGEFSTTRLLQSLQGLQFSPDGQQLAGLRTLPEPALMTWDQEGQLQHDLITGLAAEKCEPEAVQWFQERSALLVNGSVMDEKYRRIVVSVPHDFDQPAVISLQDDDHLLTTVRHDADHVYRRAIPWNQIDDSLQAMADDPSALLSPGGGVAVRVQLDDQNRSGVVLAGVLRSALERRLAASELTVQEEARLEFRLVVGEVSHRNQPVTVLQLVESDSQVVHWYAVLGEALRLADLDLNQQRQMGEMMAQRIAKLNLPYYVPATPSGLTLPYCIDR